MHVAGVKDGAEVNQEEAAALEKIVPACFIGKEALLTSDIGFKQLTEQALSGRPQRAAAPAR